MFQQKFFNKKSHDKIRFSSDFLILVDILFIYYRYCVHENVSRTLAVINPSSGMFNFLHTNFLIHFETHIQWDIWKFDTRMKILLLPCSIISLISAVRKVIELRPCLVSCQSFSRCLGQANGKIFAKSRWNSRIRANANLGSWLYYDI